MVADQGLSGPHLAAAFLCEKFLHERDGVLSFIRVIDRITVNLPPKFPPGIQLPPGIVTQPPAVQFFLVVSLKAGTLGSGKHHIRMKQYKPDGTLQQNNVSDVFFQGSDDNGAISITQMIIIAPEEGLYWFDIYFEEALLTRIPLRVLHQQMMQFQMTPS